MKLYTVVEDNLRMCMMEKSWSKKYQER